MKHILTLSLLTAIFAVSNSYTMASKILSGIGHLAGATGSTVYLYDQLSSYSRTSYLEALLQKNTLLPQQHVDRLRQATLQENNKREQEALKTMMITSEIAVLSLSGALLLASRSLPSTTALNPFFFKSSLRMLAITATSGMTIASEGEINKLANNIRSEYQKHFPQNKSK